MSLRPRSQVQREHRTVLMATDSTCYKALFNKNRRNWKNLEVSVEVSSQCCPVRAQRCHVGRPTDVDWTVGQNNGKGASE